ncbi:MAG: hypothetical protein FJY29_00415 [Betaproteobacteria bacterium]|nr:hypothetical protein [Betaproteobacteria bacterium]
MSASKTPQILYSDAHWLVVEKPYGLATHGGDPGDLGVQEWLELHLGVKTFVCSRLDKGTTGVLIFARTPEASAQAERVHTDESSRKTYYFLASKDVSKKNGLNWVCELPLDGKAARTEFFFETQLNKDVFLYKAVIARGRMHQIRRHASESGCPLWGDVEYGGCNAARIALHCAELQWPGLASVIRSPLPQSFSAEVHKQGRTAVESAVAHERRGFWFASIAQAWRVVQRGELTDYDVSVDVYGAHALVWVYCDSEREELVSALEPLLLELQHRFGVVGCVWRRIAKNPHKKGLVQEMWTAGQEPPETFTVSEHDWKALVTLTLRQHVGLFLDHRDNRRRVQQMAPGKRIANLFSYTCAFAIAAALADAEVVVNVDAAASALNVGKKNFEVNQLAERRTGKFVERDVRVWLEKQVQKIERGEDSGWDVIVCDPPTFSSTQDLGVFHVAQEWQELAENCARILRADGVCFFSMNSQAHERLAFEAALQKCFAAVQRLKAPFDFPEIAGRSHARFYACREPRFAR